jgi:hypothetical protein
LVIQGPDTHVLLENNLRNKMIVAHFDGDDIGATLELIMLDNQLDRARQYSGAVAQALQRTRDSLERDLEAEIIVCGGDDLVARWRFGSVTGEDIKHIRTQFSEFCGRTMSVGIGPTSRVATQNLRRAKLLGKDRVVSTVEGLS